MEAEPAREEPLILLQRERAEDDAELVLPCPDSGAEQRGPAQPGRGVAAREPGVVRFRQGEPSGDEALDPDRHRVEGRQDAGEPRRMFRLTREMAGEMQLG